MDGWPGKKSADANDANGVEPSDASPSSANPNGASPSGADPSEGASAPEPPRWRFVAGAKKSSGYSSVHAGSHVRGRTSDELGARYVAPDVSLYKREEEAAEVQRLDRRLPTDESPTENNVQVGKLAGNVPSRNEFSNQGNEVGKLTIQRVEPNRTSFPSGTFGGLPKSKFESSGTRTPFKEWETNLEVGPKKVRQYEWWDGKEVGDSYTMPGDEGQSKWRGEVGRLKFHGPGETQEIFVGDIAKSNRDHDGDGDGEDGFNVNDDTGDAREGALFVHNSESGNTKENISEISTALADPIDNENETKKRMCLYYLLRLLPLLLGIVIGVVLREKHQVERAVVAGALRDVLIPPIAIVNETMVPSSYPSASPNIEQSSSPSIEQSSSPSIEQSSSPSIEHSSSPSIEQSSSPSIEQSSSPSIEQSSQPSLSPSMVCPAGTELFSIEHLHHIEQNSASGMNRLTWKIKDVCSGEVIAQCPPLRSPRLDSSLTQTWNNGPTRRFKKEILESFTQCLPAYNEYVLEVLPAEDSDERCGFDPMASIVSYDNVVMKYMESTGIFGNDSNVYFGERETPCPSESPSASPSNSPTPKPTCSKGQEFNLCVAVDMSGSVCNDGTGSDCINCEAPFLPMFFESVCRDWFVSKDSCCSNFNDIKEFSSLMVNLLGDLPTEKSFSIVQFATNARLVNALSSTARTLPFIDRLDYTGGLTNHAGAIQTCQQTLPTFGNRKNFIVLITDGVPSEPVFDPEGEAERAARSAKSDGTFVVPVFISPYNDGSALAFMRRLSSDGTVFDVTDFDSLNGLQDRLVDEVSCS